MVASALVHALALGVVVSNQPLPRDTPALAVIPIALVARPGAGGGAPGPPAIATPPAEPAPPAEPPRPPEARPLAVAPVPPQRPRPVTRRPPREAAPAPATPGPETTARTDGGASTTEGGSGSGAPGTPGVGGDGSGGDGSGGAGVAYGTNPLPPYPLLARRLGKEGVVLLEVVVAADGRAADVRVLKSSGFGPLDESAATTVRRQWRFVPARRGGAPVESRVTVPIRFRLDDARG